MRGVNPRTCARTHAYTQAHASESLVVFLVVRLHAVGQVMWLARSLAYTRCYCRSATLREAYENSEM